MRKLKTKTSVFALLFVVLLLVACQAPPAPAPVAPVETVVVEDSRGVVRDMNVPGTLTSGTLVVRSAVSLPQNSLPWSTFIGAVPELTTTGAFSVTGLLEADGGITVDDTAFTVADATGATTMGGGYNSSGCTVSAAGALFCDGAVKLDSTLGVTGTASLNGATVMGGGYNSTGCTASTAGAFSCDGAVKLDSTLGVTGTTSLAGMTNMKVAVLSKNANYPVTVGDTGAVIQTSGNITLTLPAAAAGLNYCVVNYSGGDLTLDVTDTADVFLNEVNSPGDRVTNTTAWDSICVTAIDTINWMTLSSLGTWADGN